MTTSSSRRNFIKVGIAGGLAGILDRRAQGQEVGEHADLILTNARITTLDPKRPAAAAVAIQGGRFIAVGDEQGVMKRRGDATKVIDLENRTVIPGLNDSHLHLIRGGLNYNLELRWDGVPSLADALRMLREQARRTPAPC